MKNRNVLLSSHTLIHFFLFAPALQRTAHIKGTFLSAQKSDVGVEAGKSRARFYNPTAGPLERHRDARRQRVCDLSLLLHVRRAHESIAFLFATPSLLRVVSLLFFSMRVEKGCAFYVRSDCFPASAKRVPKTSSSAYALLFCLCRILRQTRRSRDGHALCAQRTTFLWMIVFSPPALLLPTS